MIIYLNSQGNPVSILPTPLNQGSVGVNELTVIAPIPSTAVCFAAYELPNGLYAYPQIIRNEDGTVSLNDPEEFALTLAENMSNQLNSANGQSLNVWTTVIKAPITQSAGNLGIQIFFADQYGNILSSSRIDYPVNRGTPILNPEVSSEDFGSIAGAVSAALAAAQSAEEAKISSYFTHTITELAEGISIQSKLNEIQDENARVLIKGIRDNARDRDLIVPANISEICFAGCSFDFENVESASGGTTILRGDLTQWFGSPRVIGFKEVSGFFCSGVIQCVNVHDCVLQGQLSAPMPQLSSVYRCGFVSNIMKDSDEGALYYEENYYVDPFTCQDYVQYENIGKAFCYDTGHKIGFISISKGISEGSVQGDTCISGTMQYRIAPQNPSDPDYPFNSGNHTEFTLENYKNDLSVGDVLTFKFVRSFDEAATITAINGATITFAPAIDLAAWAGDNSVKNAYVRCSTKPYVGDVSVEDNQFAFGNECKALGYGAFACGDNSTANGRWSRAMGKECFANFAATAEGYGCKAYGRDSHAQNSYTKAYGQSSTAMGNGTEAHGDEQVAMGMYNAIDSTSLVIVGNGTDENNRSNAYKLDRAGNGWFAGEVRVGPNNETYVKKINNRGGSLPVAYIANTYGVDVSIPVATDAVANSIARRGSAGRLPVGTPVEDNEAVPYSLYKALLARVEALEAKVN